MKQKNYNIQMTQKKVVKTFLIAFLASLMTGCSESYPGMEYDYSQDSDGMTNRDSWTEKTPIMVFVNDQNLFVAKTTRGIGPFEREDTANASRLLRSKFHVFAFRDMVDKQGSITELKDSCDFRWWVNAKNGPSGYKDENKANCLLDGPEYDTGLPLYLRPNGSGMLHTTLDGEENAEYYYSNTYDRVTYNFFAYYIDNIKPKKVNRTTNGVFLDIEIDGTQDVMCGAAPSLLDEIKKWEANSSESSAWNVLSENEKNHIKNFGGYCTFAAHRDIHPMIHFTHQLTRLRFEAYAAEEKAKDITITGIEVTSKYKGTLTAAARSRESVGIHFDDERKPLALCEAWDGMSDRMAPLRQNYYKMDKVWDESEKDKEWYDRKKLDIGSCLLLAPDTVLTVCVYYEGPMPYKIGETSPKIQKGKLIASINAPHNSLSQYGDDKYWFAPGVEYPVKLAIYGFQDIRIFASIEGWKQSDDDIKINDDEKEY